MDNDAIPGYERVACCYCNSTESMVSAKTRDWLCGLPGCFTFVQCKQCGLIRQNPRPDSNTIGTFYTDQYKPFTDARQAEATLKHRLRAWSLEYGLRRRVGMVSRYHPSGRLLDVGCAAGLFLHAAQRYSNLQVQGIEPSAPEAEYGRRQFGIEIAVGTLSDVRLDSASFDVVTMWDVLEHLHEPVAAVREVSRLLRPGGTFVFRVPHLESIDAKLFGRYWAGLEPPRHLYVFPQNVLEGMLRQAGLEPIARQCWGGYHMFALSLQFWLRARSGEQTGALPGQRLLQSMPVRMLTYPWFALVDSVGLGPAIAITAKKTRDA